MSKFDSLRVAFIGGGINSAVGRAHKIAIELDGKFKLTAGCFSRNIEISKETAKAYGIPIDKAYDDIEKLIENELENIDAIVILTPQHQHFSHIKMCIKNKIPVICEKTLTSTTNEAIELNKILEENSGFLVVINNYTGYPMVRELQAKIMEGKLGKINQILCEMPQDSFVRLLNNNQPLTPQNWRLIDREIPTISLDLGIHLYMITYFLTNSQPIELFAIAENFGNFKITDTIHCISKFEKNIIGNFWYTKTALGYRNGLKIRIFGSKGSAEWIQENPEYLFLTDLHGNTIRVDRASPIVSVANHERYQRFKAGHPSGFIEALANYYYDIAISLRQFKLQKKHSNKYIFGIEHSIDGLRFLEAIARSAKKGTVEKVL
ncbi:Gfo/Idh/MocA family protein [Hydrogenophilus thiooxidans]|uniref:Gfo/Idh/MocA family protein n=1 Tax=Hydrogenophilus thiooxidans TaxID=2820326 RepID=UPI001C220078